MAFVQIGASPLNGKVTYFKREGALYKTVANNSHEGGKLPVVRVTSQNEIDAFNANPNAFEHYVVDVTQLARLLGKPESDVKYPPVPNIADVDVTTATAAAGLSLAINGEPSVGTIVVRMGVVGNPNAYQEIAVGGNVDALKVIGGHTLAAGDVVSMTFAQFVGTYANVDAALTSLEKWQWAQPYKMIKIA